MAEQEQQWVEIEHPDVEGTYRAPVSALEHYKAGGWSEVKTAAKSERKVEQRKADS